ncbi:MAG: DegT/DnrJ/EryC1/StrS aminotransferase [Dethiosulfovibrio peptidovorans]|nr:MAG: DegT/DnrJ/EryC1/StrS aminotransferase [Dethiosulfovibrio peptidovorans]
MNYSSGLFPLEATVEKENKLFEKLCPNANWDFFLSGRCGIYHCLLDIVKNDKKKVAYLPLYTCETVVAPFVKAGYSLRFYPFDRNMRPLFSEDILDEISLISICGYYGFSNYDRDFVRKCKTRGITVMEDITHSVLSADAIDENCDYAAGSLRKWMGVACGGFAMKKNSNFSNTPMKPHEQHLLLRYEAIEQDSADLFWEGEMLLRRIFDDYGSDEKSVYIMKYADIPTICRKRRENYQCLLEHVKESENIRIVFPVLDEKTVPSHFTVYAKERKNVQAHLEALDIKCKIFWPQGPYIDLTDQQDTAYLYSHVMSLPCDQHRSLEDMRTIAEVLNSCS